MKKSILTIILLTPLLAQTKTHLSWNRKNFKTGVLHSNKGLIVKDCNCPCTGPRTPSNVCLQCGNTPMPEKIVKTVENAVEQEYNYALDFIATHTGIKRK